MGTGFLVLHVVFNTVTFQDQDYSPSPPIRISFILRVSLQFGLYPYSKYRYPEPIYFVILDSKVRILIVR